MAHFFYIAHFWPHSGILLKINFKFYLYLPVTGWKPAVPAIAPLSTGLANYEQLLTDVWMLKGTGSVRFSTSGFFSHKSVVPGPLIHILKYFYHLLLFHRPKSPCIKHEIQNNVWFSREKKFRKSMTSVFNGMLLKFFLNKFSFLSSRAILKVVF